MASLDYEKCPHCGAEAVSLVSRDEALYACGTRDDYRSPRCVECSYLVRRRGATLCGILDACSDDERRVLFDRFRREYCGWCGKRTPKGETCHCMNDE